MQKYKRLLRYSRPQRSRLASILALTFAASGLAALQPWPMKLLVDHVLGPTPLPRFLESAFQFVDLKPTPTVLLTACVIAGLAVFALSTLLEWTLTWTWTLAGRRMVYDLSEDLFAAWQRRSMLFHSRSSIGDAMSRITGDSWCVYQAADTLLVAPIHALLTLAMMVFLMAQLDATLTLISLAIAPLVVGGSLLVGGRLRAVAKVRREAESRIQSHIQQTLTGIPVVQAFVQEERESRRLRHFADAVIAAQQRGAWISGISNLSAGLFATAGIAAVLWTAARHVLAGSLSIGGILVFLVYLNSLQNQLRVLANGHSAFQNVKASLDRVLEILAAETDTPEKPGAAALSSVRGEVRFERVTFGYQPDRPVLQEISLEALPGQTLAIVGPTGAGKSTLINLIPRFFDPSEGRVLLDGRDVRDLPLRSLRRQIAVVLQESFLFPISVADNIAYGRPDASIEQVEAAARAASAHEFIARLPQGYRTVVGERGATLSVGERQRIAIARAHLIDAPILILDEPTSAIDAETERSILDALAGLMKGRTTFVVAHRLSTVRRADCILVLQDARMVERGTHAELLALNGAYASLHRRQFPAETPAAAAAG